MTPSTRSCFACSAPVPQDALFCSACGTPTGRTDPGAASPVGSPAQAIDELYRACIEEALGPGYELLGHIGRGGFAEVFAARDLRLKRSVAVKALRPHLAAQADIVARFRREAEAVAQLRHPHIVPIYSVGEGGGAVFYTMPLVEGESLAAHLARKGALDVAEAWRVLSEAASALCAAERAGIVHRDIKPENIMLEGEERRTLLMDFGIAKAIGAAEAGLTRTGAIIGTPQYMSPEQAAGQHEVDHRSDFYALGVVGYQMLSGRLPFTGRTPHEWIVHHLMTAPAALHTLRPDVPRELSAVIMRCLAKRPDDRPQTARELLRAIKDAAPAPVPLPAAPTVFGRHRVLPYLLGILAAELVIAGVVLRRERGAGRAPDASVIAILPFRVAASDTSLTYLREGMVDLLADNLGGEEGLRPADVSSVLRAWRRATRSEADDLPEDAALRLARERGAGQVVRGVVAGTAGNVRISARLLSVESGQRRATAEVAGPADSVQALVDTLTAELLSLEAGERQRVSVLTRVPLAALKAYLAGQRSYRRGHYSEAASDYERALEIDSTFANAALGLVVASNYMSIGNDVGEWGLRLAWAAKRQLIPRDTHLLTAYAGPHYPAWPTQSERIAAWEQAARAAGDRPEPWFELGEQLLLYGRYLGVKDWQQRAAVAFERALAQDPSFTPPMERLVVLATKSGDTVRARAVANRLFATDSTRDWADYLRWRLAVSRRDTSGLRRLRNDFARFRHASLGQIWQAAQLDGDSIAVRDADLAASARATTAVVATERADAAGARYILAVNRGQPQRAARNRVAMSEGRPVETLLLAQAVRDALFEAGDQGAGAHAVEELASRTRELEADLKAMGGAEPPPFDAARLYVGLCAVEHWRIGHGSLETAAATISRLRELARSVYPGRVGGNTYAVVSAKPVCPAVLEALLSAAQQRPDAAALLDTLDTLMTRGPMDLDAPVGNLVVAQLREARGDLSGALNAIRRRPYATLGLFYLARSLREEGRLAAMVGDTAGAIQAYRHYLALRPDPEPLVRPEVERVRSELASLQRNLVARTERPPVRASQLKAGRGKAERALYRAAPSASGRSSVVARTHLPGVAGRGPQS